MAEVKNPLCIVLTWPFKVYGHTISSLSEEDGGGYLITFSDLPGCMADGDTEIVAGGKGRHALIAVVSAFADIGRDNPVLSFSPENAAAPGASGKFVARVPKSLHARLNN